MEIHVSEEQGNVPVTIFQVKGTVRSNQELEEKANEAYASGARNILIDFSDVDYMSSAGLRALHAIYSMLKGEKTQDEEKQIQEGIKSGDYHSSHLKLSSVNDNVMEVLSMTGYDMFIEIHKNLKDGLDSF